MYNLSVRRIYFDGQRDEKDETQLSIYKKSGKKRENKQNRDRIEKKCAVFFISSRFSHLFPSGKILCIAPKKPLIKVQYGNCWLRSDSPASQI